MDDLLVRGARCPHCRGIVRPDAAWCSTCYADLRPPPPPPPPPVLTIPPTAAYGAAALDPLTAPAAALGLPGRAPGAEPTWPCASCGGVNPLLATACTACGAGFLAGLREAEGPLLELPGVGDLTRLSRAQRIGFAFAVVAAVVLVTLLLGLLLG